MIMKNYELFFAEPNTVEEMFCRVCGTRCSVERNLYDATNWIDGMARRYRYHDRFQCPHSGQPWHEQAVELYMQMEETESKRVAALMRQDLDDILREHGIEPPNS